MNWKEIVHNYNSDNTQLGYHLGWHKNYRHCEKNLNKNHIWTNLFDQYLLSRLCKNSIYQHLIVVNFLFVVIIVVSWIKLFLLSKFLWGLRFYNFNIFRHVLVDCIWYCKHCCCCGGCWSAHCCDKLNCYLYFCKLWFWRILLRDQHVDIWFVYL